MENVNESGFDLVLQPLDIIINLIYDNSMKGSISELYSKYQDDVLKTTSANDEIKDIINNASKQALSLLSKRYRDRLLQFYNTDGLSYYVYVHINRLAMAHLEELISNK